MTSPCLPILAITVLTLLTAGQAVTESRAWAASDPSTATTVFKPKNRGAPIVRIGGGTRGPDRSGPELYVLAPEQVGFTTQTQPVLYWYLSGPVREKIEIALADRKSVLLKTTTEGLADPGIQSLNLASHGIRLQPAVQYRWSVSLINDPSQRSRDTFSSGVVEYTPASAQLKAELAEAHSRRDRAGVYAREGFWYDALEAVQAETQPVDGDDTAALIRKSLLEQVGLPGWLGKGESTGTR